MGKNKRSATAVRDRSLGAPVKVEIDGSRDALALSEVLIPYHSFLVHHEGRRWVVHARAPGCHDESLDDALRTIEDWLAEHGLDGASGWIGDRPYQFGPHERT